MLKCVSNDDDQETDGTDTSGRQPMTRSGKADDPQQFAAVRGRLLITITIIWLFFFCARPLMYGSAGQTNQKVSPGLLLRGLIRLSSFFLMVADLFIMCRPIGAAPLGPQDRYQ